MMNNSEIALNLTLKAVEMGLVKPAPDVATGKTGNEYVTDRNCNTAAQIADFYLTILNKLNSSDEHDFVALS